MYQTMTGFSRYVPKDKTYYLASPYSHRDPRVKEFRAFGVQVAAAMLTMQGYRLLEPITSCHAKSQIFQLPTGYEYWQTRDRDYIARSDGVIVFAMQGWKESVGVCDELEYAKELGLPVYMLGQNAIFPQSILDDMLVESVKEDTNKNILPLRKSND